MMKKILALMLALLTVAAMSSCKKEDETDLDSLKNYLNEEVSYTSYTDPDTNGVFYFESIDSASVKITRYEGPVEKHTVTIPTSVPIDDEGNKKTVTTIGEEAFRTVSSIETLIIREGITTIEKYAFAQCMQMTTVSLPNKLEKIGEGAFMQCGITELILPTSESLTRIGNYAFSKCNNLETVTIPGNIKTVGEAAFFECAGLKEIVLEQGVTTVEKLGFQGCTSLEELELPASFENAPKPNEDLAFLGSDVLYYENIKAPENTNAYAYKEAMKDYLKDAPVENN